MHPSLSPDLSAAAAFLESIAGKPDPEMLFVCLPDKKGPDGKPLPGGMPVHIRGRLTDVLPRLVAENAANKGVFVTINEVIGNTRKGTDVIALRAVFIDQDQPPFIEPAQCHVPPSIMVNSGRGRHTYWLLKEGQRLADFSGAQRRLIARYNSDPAVTDLPRIMRVPGFFHMKGQYPVKVEYFDVDPTGNAVYSLDEATYSLPQDPRGHENQAASPVGYRLAGGGTRLVTRRDLLQLSKAKGTPGWTADILKAICATDQPFIDPAVSKNVDDTITRFLAWLAYRYPDANVSALFPVLAPAWAMLSAEDARAGRLVYTTDDLHRKMESAWRYVHEKRSNEIEADPWLDLVARDHDGSLVASRANLEIIFRHHPEWRGVIAFDDRFRRLVYRQNAPWMGKPWTPKLPDDSEAFPGLSDTPVLEQHAGLVAAWFGAAEGVYLTRLTTTAIHEAIEAVAMENRFDSFREWLDSQTWDGTFRLQSWLHRYLGADDSEWTQAVGARWMIAGAARVLEPGCKVDEMLVLEGSQGTRKSSALRALAGPEFFSDSMPRNGDPTDVFTSCIGPVIMEIPEIDGWNRRREASEIKAFLSKQTDRFRPKFGRREIEAPRRLVFAGSTNEHEWLFDPTGGRRFWPVPVADRAAVGSRSVCDVDGLAADRGQLWAEAAFYVRAGMPWHLVGPEAALARTQQSARRESDPWEDTIRSYLDPKSPEPITGIIRRNTVTSSEILTRVMEIDKGKWSPVDTRRVGAILRGMGFDRVKSNGSHFWRRVGSHSDTPEVAGVPQSAYPVPMKTDGGALSN